MTATATGAAPLKVSPEVSNVWECPACEERTHFLGVDFETWGGRDVCHCGAYQANRLRHTGEDAECVCVTTLVQPLEVLRDEYGNFVELDHHRFEGGGSGAEIGDYDKIVCGQCGLTVWLDARYPATFGQFPASPANYVEAINVYWTTIEAARLRLREAMESLGTKDLDKAEQRVDKALGKPLDRAELDRMIPKGRTIPNAQEG